MPEPKLSLMFCFFPWRFRAAASILCAQCGSWGRATRRLQHSAPHPGTHIHKQFRVLSLPVFSHCFQRREGLSRAHNMWSHNYTAGKQSSVFSIEVLLQNKEKGKKTTPFFTNFKLMQRNEIAAKKTKKQTHHHIGQNSV